MERNTTIPAGVKWLPLLLTIPLWGQDAPAPPPPLVNLGKPITVSYHCTVEDIQWAGLSCSDEEPCPIYLEIAAVEAAGNRIAAVGNIHADAVTLYSVLLGSEDDGRTWRELFPRIRGASLDHVQFVDATFGWASGQSVSPLPQDPFLLLTSDGGATWRRHPIFEESRFGSIQQLAFRDKTTGSLVIDRGTGSDGDRYALYESPNGGETWLIKEESNRPMRLPYASATPPSWQVRADGATRAFHLEHREDKRWTSVASFAVKLGACETPADAPQTAPPADPVPPTRH